MQTISAFSQDHLPALCNQLAQKDAALDKIIKEYGYPPFWTRKASFETLIHIILEQQVSLASAKAALVKLKQKMGIVTPGKLLQLSDADLKACYFSRQKIVYARCLAEAVIDKKISIKKLATLPDEEVRRQLTSIKGIGNWTTDVFLMMVLHRTDLFPAGDIALMNSVRHIKELPADSSTDTILLLAETWRPFRTVAAFLCWHAYIRRKNIVY
jgi:DNA-3-methyladenine glycosylase II